MNPSDLIGGLLLIISLLLSFWMLYEGLRATNRINKQKIVNIEQARNLWIKITLSSVIGGALIGLSRFWMNPQNKFSDVIRMLKTMWIYPLVCGISLGAIMGIFLGFRILLWIKLFGKEEE